MSTGPLTPHGELLEHARTEVLHLSASQAAARAGISGTYWKQVVTGVASRQGTLKPIKATPRTLVAMSAAVGLDPAAVLAAAGMPTEKASVEAMIADLQQQAEKRADDGPPLVDEIERIWRLRSVPARDKLRMAQVLIALYKEDEDARSA